MLTSCSISDLKSPMASALASTLAAELIPFARPVDAKRSNRVEMITFDVDVELAQRAVYDIRHVERIAAIFDLESENTAPEVLALRHDFPVDVPHTNLRDVEYPRSLCLYDVKFRDVRAQWTPARFVSLIREWLRLTARGELHATDQPLEPILPAVDAWVVLPASIRESGSDMPKNETVVTNVALKFVGREDHAGKPVLVAEHARVGPAGSDLAAVAMVVRTRPRTHGVFRRTPATLAEVHAMLAEGGDDLVGSLRTALKDWDGSENERAAHFMLIVLVPMRRAEGADAEHIEVWALFSERTMADVADDVGAWALRDGQRGIILFPEIEQDGRRVPVGIAGTFFTVLRDDLARLNGLPAAADHHILAIGGGALGSQILNNAARAAFGQWTIVDDDMLLPHNLARHSLPFDATAHHKATALAWVANRLTSDNTASVHTGIVADVLDPKEEATPLAEAFRRAELIADISASVTVARSLALDVNASARRVSVFLSPNGNDLTLLAEDAARGTTLDSLEMQLYRAMVHTSALRDLLSGATGRIRYGRSCRDVSVQLPQAMVSLHAGIATIALQRTLRRPAAHIAVWRVHPATLNVLAIETPVADMRVCTSGTWRVVCDVAVLERLQELRATRLPNETGGVLLGAHDLQRRIAYVVDVIPSPSDSHEYPTSYLRGCEGLTDAVEHAKAVTDGQLHYIGEWHTHPDGHSCRASPDDQVFFRWLTEEMAADGLPPLMVIVGSGVAVPYIEHLDPAAGEPAHLHVTVPANDEGVPPS